MTLLLLLALASNVEAPAGRVDAARAIERARYAFVIGATQAFDVAYPRAQFEQRVARELSEERVLEQVFALTVTPALLAREFDRIEKTTKAPEQWEAVKAALGHDRRRIEEVFCRPLVVHQALEARFAFDPGIHAETHARARQARTMLLEGRTPPGAVRMILGRRGSPDVSTEDLLQEARAQAGVPRVIEPPVEDTRSAPVALDPAAAAVLETHLLRPGDVSTVLWEWDRFAVYRLVASTADAWTVDAVTLPKRDFEEWFQQAAR